MRENLYAAKTVAKGTGVFTSTPIAPGLAVVTFGGPLLSGSEVEDENRCIQIGPDRYLGPSGELDDFVNHSCAPNCGLVLNGETLTLVALRQIAPDQELTFDYSTATNLGDQWSMICQCQSPECRGVVRDFDLLPSELKSSYLSQGVVPSYILLNGSARSKKPASTPFQMLNGAKGLLNGCSQNGQQQQQRGNSPTANPLREKQS